MNIKAEGGIEETMAVKIVIVHQHVLVVYVEVAWSVNITFYFRFRGKKQRSGSYSTHRIVGIFIQIADDPTS